MADERLIGLARFFSTRRVKEAYDSLLSGRHDWRIKEDGEAHRTRPYPMGFYPNDKNLYWAIGWGMSDYMFPHERWLLRSTARQLAPSPDRNP